MSRTAFFVICVISIFVAGFVFLFLEIQKIKNMQVNYQPASAQITYPEEQTTNSQINITTQPIATLSPKATSNPTSAPVVTTALVKQVTYVPISSEGSTTSTEWVTVDGSDFYIALQDYGGKPTSVTFEANLSVPNGSGTISARLYNVTQNIAVSGSEVSASSIDYTLKSSGNLNLWNGNNLYVVQIMSLNSQDVSFGSGRIKILY